MHPDPFPYLHTKVKHPRTDKLITCHIESIVIESGIAKNAVDYLTPLHLGTNLALVADDHTLEALGHQVFRGLQKMGNAKLITLGDHPAADESTVEWIREESKTCDALIAVGSGTLNDLCKYASFLDSKPYAVFASAPSMNGYASANASITVKDHKQSLQAHLPAGLFFDLDVIAAAPKRLIQSGLGDSICRSTAQADWLLSHLLLGTPYDETPFQLLAPYEPPLLENAKGLIQGDRELLKHLVTTLILSGMGMVIAGGSYPASQAEHLIVHTMEMIHGDSLPESFHGERVGVATLCMASLQENLLKKLPQLKHKPLDEEALSNYFGPRLAPQIIKDYRKKNLGALKVKQINQRLGMDWEMISNRIRQISVPFWKLQKALEDAQAPMVVEQLGWNIPDFSKAVAHAHFIRDRFTFLDLSYYTR